ncbi:hypothetical protein EVAR_61899_1 [Eumeta japonica]|uniref:Uncharacterized protein n=1 Tax=Eumeta variegata TaxID=151549 RepID=A0A4C1YNK4_EUMVA|nr:hypothetical protein EVAR_61899_1 [Eumeta japonica]
MYSNEIVNDGIADPKLSQSSISSTSSSLSTDFTKPHLLMQSDLNYLVHNLGLSKAKTQLLGSRLQLWNLSDKKTRASYFRNKQEDFMRYFIKEDDLVFCNDAKGLVQEMGFPEHPEECRLFIDSSKISLKGVLLHNGNKYPSIPLAHATNMKENYGNIQLLLERIKYSQYTWNICADLKVVTIITGLQGEYTKFCFFLYEWDSRAKEKHYVVKNWPQRMSLIPGVKNVKEEVLARR